MDHADPFSYALDPDMSDEPSFQDLLAYWQGKRAGRDVPLRSDVDPLELKAHMGSLVILECLPGLVDFRHRLVGTNITQTYGRDTTGRTTREVYGVADPVFCEALLGVFREVATRRKPARGRAALRSTERDYRLVDVLVLPLAGEDGTVTRLMNELLFR
jgi:hypothetical protein